MINILQVGMGPLGVKIASFIAQRPGMRTVAAVDKNPALVGKDVGELIGQSPSGVKICASVDEALKNTWPQVAILTTVSDMGRVTGQILGIVSHGIPVISTCEELSFPWHTAPALAQQIDEAARKFAVGVLGTGVNPGFLMDTLPTSLTAVCQQVKRIEVNRYQNARHRRLPFQKKIGAGLSLEQFEQKKLEGSLRHVGLTESIHMIAHRMGWKLDRTEDIISPVVADQRIETETMTIEPGYATGVRQVGNGYVGDEVKIKLVFQATVGEPESFDEVVIEGTPSFRSKIDGGINGDIATCAIVLNAIPQLLRSGAGLKTMMDIPPVSWFS